MAWSRIAACDWVSAPAIRAYLRVRVSMRSAVPVTRLCLFLPVIAVLLGCVGCVASVTAVACAADLTAVALVTVM